MRPGRTSSAARTGRPGCGRRAGQGREPEVAVVAARRRGGQIGHLARQDHRRRDDAGLGSPPAALARPSTAAYRSSEPRRGDAVDVEQHDAVGAGAGGDVHAEVAGGGQGQVAVPTRHGARRAPPSRPRGSRAAAVDVAGRPSRRRRARRADGSAGAGPTAGARGGRGARARSSRRRGRPAPGACAGCRRAGRSRSRAVRHDAVAVRRGRGRCRSASASSRAAAEAAP